MGLLGDLATLVLWGASILVSTVAAAVNTPTKSVGGPLFATPSPHLFVDLSVMVTLTCVMFSLQFWFAFLWWFLTLSTFPCAYWPSVRCLWRAVCLGLLPSVGLGCCIAVELYELSVNFGNQALVSNIWKCFLPVHRLSFCFVYGFLLLCNSLYVWLGPILFLLLSLLPWETNLRKYWCGLCQENVLPVFSSMSLTVSCLIFNLVFRSFGVYFCIWGEGLS